MPQLAAVGAAAAPFVCEPHGGAVATWPLCGPAGRWFTQIARGSSAPAHGAIAATARA